jgi:hypothetical protein
MMIKTALATGAAIQEAPKLTCPPGESKDESQASNSYRGPLGVFAATLLGQARGSQRFMAAASNLRNQVTGLNFVKNTQNQPQYEKETH